MNTDVLVQEEPVEPLVEIVVMRDVPTRDPGMARAPASRPSAPRPIAEPARSGQRIGPEAGEGQVEKLADIAPLDTRRPSMYISPTARPGSSAIARSAAASRIRTATSRPPRR